MIAASHILSGPPKVVKAVKALLQPVPEVLDEAAWSVFCLGFAEVAVLDLVLRANLGK